MTVEKAVMFEAESLEDYPHGLRVLAVDDDPLCLKLLDTLLRKCQYNVTTTNQAKVALVMLRENKGRFDIVISDVHMPDMDGFKLLELVGLEMDLPVIMLSAYSDPKLVLKGVTHGACDYLVKPVRMEELRNIWQHVIRRKKFEPKGQTMSTDQAKDIRPIGEDHSAHSNVNSNRKRKEYEDDSEDNEVIGEDPSTRKKPRVMWCRDLHGKFVEAVNQLGIDKAFPKRILDLMNVEGLTRENVASHLQKFRIYLKKISFAQQADMAAALGVKDSQFMQIGSCSGIGGDIRGLAGSGRLENSLVSRYVTGGMLGRMDLSIRNLSSSSLMQRTHGLSNIQQSATQSSNFFKGSMNLDELQMNRCAPGIGSIFSGQGEAAGRSTSILNGTPSYAMIQTLSGSGFKPRSSFNSEPLNADLVVPSNLLEDGAMESSKARQQNSLLSDDAFYDEFPVNSRGQNGFSTGSYLQNNGTGFFSSACSSSALPREDTTQRWGDQGFIYNQSSISGGLGSLNTCGDVIPSQQMNMFSSERIPGGSSNVKEGLGTESSKLLGEFVSHGYDSFDDVMNAIIKREDDEAIPNCAFGVYDWASL